MRGRLAVMFRALGGDRGVRIAPGGPSASAHRLSLRQRLGIGVERIDRAVLDGATLQLPLAFDLFPQQADLCMQRVHVHGRSCFSLRNVAEDARGTFHKP